MGTKRDSEEELVDRITEAVGKKLRGSQQSAEEKRARSIIREEIAEVLPDALDKWGRGFFNVEDDENDDAGDELKGRRQGKSGGLGEFLGLSGSGSE